MQKKNNKMMMIQSRRQHSQQRLVMMLLLVLSVIVPGFCTSPIPTSSIQKKVSARHHARFSSSRYVSNKTTRTTTTTKNNHDNSLSKASFIITTIPRGGGISSIRDALDTLDKGRVLTGLLGFTIYLGNALYERQFPITRNVDTDDEKVTLSLTRRSAIYSSMIFLAYGIIGCNPKEMLRYEFDISQPTKLMIPELILHYMLWMVIYDTESSTNSNHYIQLIKACYFGYLIVYFTIRTIFYNFDCNPRIFVRWGSFLIAMLGYTKFSSPKLVRKEEPSETTPTTVTTKNGRRGYLKMKHEQRR